MQSSKSLACQQLGDVYHPEGVSYTTQCSDLLDQQSIVEERPLVLVQNVSMVRINIYWNLKLAKFIDTMQQKQL